MQLSELYRQRAAECERLARKKPDEREQLAKVAETWRWLADAADDFSTSAETLH